MSRDLPSINENSIHSIRYLQVPPYGYSMLFLSESNVVVKYPKQSIHHTIWPGEPVEKPNKKLNPQKKSPELRSCTKIVGNDSLAVTPSRLSRLTYPMYLTHRKRISKTTIRPRKQRWAVRNNGTYLIQKYDGHTHTALPQFVVL